MAIIKTGLYNWLFPAFSWEFDHATKFTRILTNGISSIGLKFRKKSFKKICDKKLNFQNEIGPWINSRLRKRKPKSRMLRFGRFVFHRDVRESLSDWSVLPGFILESKKCTGDCEDSYVQCIIDCKSGTDCQSRCARDYTNCNEHCPCYNFCYEGKLTLDQGSTDTEQPDPIRAEILDLIIIY